MVTRYGLTLYFDAAVLPQLEETAGIDTRLSTHAPGNPWPVRLNIRPSRPAQMWLLPRNLVVAVILRVMVALA